MNHTWKDDPRIRSMDPEKIRFLSELTDQISRIPKNQLMNRFVSMITEANRKGIFFSDQETEILTDILIDYMSPADRGKLDLFRMLSRQMGRHPQSSKSACRSQQTAR